MSQFTRVPSPGWNVTIQTAHMLTFYTQYEYKIAAMTHKNFKTLSYDLFIFKPQHKVKLLARSKQCSAQPLTSAMWPKCHCHFVLVKGPLLLSPTVRAVHYPFPKHFAGTRIVLPLNHSLFLPRNTSDALQLAKGWSRAAAAQRKPPAVGTRL